MFEAFLGYITNIVTDKQIGVQIKKARLEKRLSQEELGERLGVTWEMISRYENGRSSARKYLTQLAEILDKPISYFFGISEKSITYEVDQIVEKLRERGIGYNSSNENKIILIDDFSILGFERSLKLTRKYYSVPEWLVEKYTGLFALRLSSLQDTADLNIEMRDVGFFSKDELPQKGDYVLIQDGRFFKLIKYTPKLQQKVLAILLVQEKRFK